jgi:hypothetical protein
MSLSNRPEFQKQAACYKAKEVHRAPYSDLAQEASMISPISSALSLQSNPRTDRLSSKQRLFIFHLDRSRASRHRHRVLASARKVAATFDHDIEDRQSQR